MNVDSEAAIRALALEERVERGVALLDAHLLSWEHHINWETLDIWSLQDCIIGQLSREFGIIDLLSMLGLGSYFDGQAFGFDLPGGGPSEDYAPLNEAWRNWARSMQLI